MNQSDFFASDESSTKAEYNLQTTDLKDVRLDYYRNFLDDTKASIAFERLTSELDWQQPDIRIAGRILPIPRKQVWFGDKAYQYTYSGKMFTAAQWHPLILELKRTIETKTGQAFNSALCNLYRDGQDSVSWHADDEPELGPAPVIASYSLGESRSFHLREKKLHHHKFKLNLEHNSLLIMGAGLQRDWEHQVPKTKKPVSPRINITFRLIC